MEVETHSGRRAQKTPSPGTRPAPPSEVAGPHGGAVTMVYVAAGAPHAVVPSLAGGDAVDISTVAVLLQAALKQKEEEKEKEDQEQKDKELEVHLAR